MIARKNGADFSLSHNVLTVTMWLKFTPTMRGRSGCCGQTHSFCFSSKKDARRDFSIAWDLSLLRKTQYREYFPDSWGDPNSTAVFSKQEAILPRRTMTDEGINSTNKIIKSHKIIELSVKEIVKAKMCLCVKIPKTPWCATSRDWKTNKLL